jgi:arsenate reductase (thioredoxin)
MTLDGNKTAGQGKKRIRVLFVCLGNACRSQIAEAVARREARDIIEASSAGLTPLGRIPELTTEALLLNGYSAQGLFSKGIDPEIWAQADLVINMSGEAKSDAFPDYSKVEDWSVPDPFGSTPNMYQKILVQIESKVRQLAARLRAEQNNHHKQDK